MNNLKPLDIVAGVLLMLATGWSSGMLMAVLARDHYWQAQAIAHHAAHYDMNPTNGVTTWNWNE